MAKSVVYSVRLDKPTEEALARAAASAGTKPRTLAAAFVVANLERLGFLPKSKPLAQRPRV
jgi:hypothetical protein